MKRETFSHVRERFLLFETGRLNVRFCYNLSGIKNYNSLLFSILRIWNKD